MVTDVVAYVYIMPIFVLIYLVFSVIQRDESKCPSLPNACTCTSDSTGPQGPQGPVVSQLKCANKD